MRKVKNTPGNYVKRSQIRSVSGVVTSASTSPKKRTIDDFRSAKIDENFYITFLSRDEPHKRNRQ